MSLCGQSPTHLFAHVFFLQGHSQSGDDTSLHVQDGGSLSILGVQFHVVLTLDHNLQGVSKRKTWVYFYNIESCSHHFFYYFLIHPNAYLSISVAKSSEVAAGLNRGLPSASMSATSLRRQSVVRTMKLQVWGTSIST